MTLEVAPFDFGEALVSDEEIAFFVEDALESGDTHVFARAVEIAARAKKLEQLAEEGVELQRRIGETGATSLPFDTVSRLLAKLGLELHLTPALAAA